MRPTLWLVALALAGCEGGAHRRGEWQVIGDVSFGSPAGNFVLAGRGEDAPCVGGRLSGAAFVRDRTAVIVAGGYRHYEPDSGSVDAREFQIGPRYYPPVEFQLGKVPVAPFVDGFGGVLHASTAFPVDGTDTNLSAEFGVGLETILGEQASLLVGYRFRHLSNGGGNEPNNPGYNDHQIYFGFGWRW
jgi:hypothetical protein